MKRYVLARAIVAPSLVRSIFFFFFSIARRCSHFLTDVVLTTPTKLNSCCTQKIIDWTPLLQSRRRCHHHYHKYTATTILCALTQVVAFSSTVRYFNYSNKVSSTSSSWTNDFVHPHFHQRHKYIIEPKPFLYSNRQTTKMSSSSTSESPYHDEIAKAIAAAKEMRDISENKDEAPLTIFDKIIAGDIPCNKVFEDDMVLAFHDVNPVAPIHILVIPKVRRGLTQISNASTHEHQVTLGHLMMVASQIGKQYCKTNGFRIVINDGEHGGQSVYHLHVHVIGGRQMQWPPG